MVTMMTKPKRFHQRNPLTTSAMGRFCKRHPEHPQIGHHDHPAEDGDAGQVRAHDHRISEPGLPDEGHDTEALQPLE